MAVAFQEGITERSFDPEEEIRCPYVMAHLLPRKRMAMHLEKCRKNKPELAKEMATCIFNYAHRLPAREMKIHQETCLDREGAYNWKFRSNTPNEVLQKLEKNVMKELDIGSSEVWNDDDFDYQPNSVLRAIERRAKDKSLLKNHTNIPPAERKALRNEYRKKMQDLLKKEELLKHNQNLKFSSSVANSNSSPLSVLSKSPIRNLPSSSSKSVMSDSSFTTALDTVISRLNDFQIVAHKKGSDRSASQLNATPSSSPAEI